MLPEAKTVKWLINNEIIKKPTKNAFFADYGALVTILWSQYHRKALSPRFRIPVPWPHAQFL